MKKNIHPAVIQFLNDFQFSYDKNKIVNWDDHYYYADFDIPSLERIKFLRYGLSLGEIKNNRFIPFTSRKYSLFFSKKSYIMLIFFYYFHII